MSWFFKSKQVNLAILVASFLIGFVPYFLKIPQIYEFTVSLTNVASVVGQFTIVIAIYSQYRRSLKFIRERRKGWVYNIYLLALMSLMILMGFTLGEHHATYMWLVNSIVAPCSSVVYGILAFYMFSAGARAFRARSLKASLLIVGGITVLLYQAPLTGSFLPGISPYAVFLSQTVGMSLNRMFAIAIITGAIMLNVRMLTGRELAFLGFAREEES